jgi:hypothetical protein
MNDPNPTSGPLLKGKQGEWEEEPSWQGLTLPSIALASASVYDFARRVDTRRMDGRIKSGHDGIEQEGRFNLTIVL